MGSVEPSQDRGRGSGALFTRCPVTGTSMAAAARTMPSPPVFLVGSECTALAALASASEDSSNSWDQPQEKECENSSPLLLKRSNSGACIGARCPGSPSRVNVQLSTEVADFITEYWPPSLPRMNPLLPHVCPSASQINCLLKSSSQAAFPGILSGRKTAVNTCTTLRKAWEL